MSIQIISSGTTVIGGRPGMSIMGMSRPIGVGYTDMFYYADPDYYVPEVVSYLDIDQYVSPNYFE